jgi:hypothetical protein
MGTGSKFKKLSIVFVLCAVGLSLGTLQATDATSTHRTTHSKKTKKPELPPLPSGPTGQPVPQLPLDSIKPVAPQVSFQNGQLTIVAPNSTLGDILRAVHKQTGAEIDIPDAPDRVVTNLGPGPARAVVAELLNGSRFNYVLLGSPVDANLLTRVVLVAKSGPDNPAPSKPGGQPGTQADSKPSQDAAQDASDADAPDDNSSADEVIEQPPAEAADQPAGDQPAVKTPQQMLQEMQQRQMQFQQQQQQLQQGAQPPTPGMPQRPPQPPEQ